jgi:cysteine desulfurase / selenocysteine lyase
LRRHLFFSASSRYHQLSELKKRMSTRRGFVKKIATGFAATALTTEALTASPGEPPVPKSDPQFWKEVRNAFPLTRKRVYFNNGTFGPSPSRVLNAIKSSIDFIGNSGEYGSTDRARKRISTFVKVKTEEISLTHNTTEGINIVTWGLPLKAGDEVIITQQEHVGNAVPWLNRAKLHGIVLKPFQPALTASENVALIRQLITPRTKVIAIPHITCTTGLVFPIEEISALARSKGIFTAIDGAHGAGFLNLDLKALGCDFYATSCHKWMLGPSGTGFLYVREELFETLQAYWVGAHSDKGWDLQTTPVTFNGYVNSAHRYDFGSQNASLYAGVEETITFLEEIGMERIEKRIRYLSTYLQQKLLAFGDKIEMLTPVEAQSRAGMITFRIPGKDFADFNALAQKNNFRIRMVPESNLNALRISTHIYNSPAEIDRFAELVASAI